MPLSSLNLSSLPISLRSILTHCDGVSLDLRNKLSGLPLQKKEEVLEYITIHFPYLKTLSLVNNNLKSLPDSIGNLTELTYLNLSGNQLTSLPDWISNLTQLTELRLVRNQLTSLPESIGKLSQLIKLFLAGNQLADLPESIGELVHLTELHLDINKLTSLPKSTEKLIHLTELSLVDNQLISLPESIGNLSKLAKLILLRNQLTSLPDSIGNLTQLTELELSCNKLTNLPDSIGNLTQLTELNLSNNLLQSLTFSMINLPEAMQLLLMKNPINFPPQDVIKSVSQSNDRYGPIKDFLKKVFEKYAPTLPEIRHAKTFLSYASLSKETYALIHGNSFIASKSAVSQANEPTQETEELIQPLPSVTWFPPEVRQKIFLFAVKVESVNQRQFMKGFRELVKDKSNGNIMRFLNKTSPNWEEAIKSDFEKEREGVSLNR